MPDYNVEALKALIANNQSLSDWSVIAVFIGLLGEIIIIFAFSKDKPRSETVLSFICGSVIAIGVFGEYRFGSKAAQGNAQLQGISDRKVADLNTEAWNAQEMAESERLERIKLEAIVAPRSLSLEQQRLIVASLHRFSGHSVRLSSYGLDGEGAALGAQIISALRSAGIVVEDSRASFISTGGFELGVHVRGPDADRDFISGLAGALSSIGKLQVFVNGPSFRAGATIGGSAAMGGGATIGGGGGAVNVPIPATGPVSLMVGIKPVPILATK